MRNLPETEIADLREYIYVDENRVRSLLAQLGNGVLVDREISNSRSKRLQIGLKGLGFAGESTNSDTERLATADLHVSMFEEDATALGMLSDVSDQVTKPKNWKQGKLRKSLEPGMLLRLTAPTQLFDPESIVDVLRGLDVFQDEDDDEFTRTLAMADSLYGKSLALSIRPTDPPDPGCAFLGLISHAQAFLGLQRDLLFSRLGPEAPLLTSIVQIARVPTERDTEPPAMQRLEELGRQISNTGVDNIDRKLLDDMMVQMMRIVEDTGLRSAPKWPSIAVVPLAIYRNIPPAPQLNGLDDPRYE